MNLRKQIPWRGDGRGFTAFETLVAVTILAFVTAAVSGALSAGRQQTRHAQDTVQAALLARGLLDEILRLPFVDPENQWGPTGWEQATRTRFNNLADYANYTDGPTGLGYLGINGSMQPVVTAYPPEYQGFVRTVTMSVTPLTPPTWGRTINGLSITVTVSKNGAVLATVQRYVSPS